jgi:methionine synthase II (cobalamin-independent)
MGVLYLMCWRRNYPQDRGTRPLYPAERVFLNPDCGFGTFSNRPVNSSEIAFKKLQAIVG